MKVRVRLFGALRERAGTGELEIELPEGAVVGDVWPALPLDGEPPGLLFARNRAYAERGERLEEGDEIAVIPPVSGGSFVLTEQPLSIEGAIGEVRDRDAGGIATFVGTTRRQARGREVLHLEYEAYEGMAEKVMEDLAASLKVWQQGHFLNFIGLTRLVSALWAFAALAYLIYFAARRRDG